MFVLGIARVLNSKEDFIIESIIIIIIIIRFFLVLPKNIFTYR